MRSADPARALCSDCPDTLSCRDGFPCDIVRIINNIPQKEAIMAANKPQNDVVTAAEEIVEASVPKQGSTKVEVIEQVDGNDVIVVTEKIATMDRVKNFLKAHKNAMAGLAAAVVVAGVAIAKYNKTVAEEVVDDAPSDEPSES